MGASSTASIRKRQLLQVTHFPCPFPILIPPPLLLNLVAGSLAWVALACAIPFGWIGNGSLMLLQRVVAMERPKRGAMR